MVDKLLKRCTSTQLADSLVHCAPNDHECNVPAITVGSMCCRGAGPAATSPTSSEAGYSCGLQKTYWYRAEHFGDLITADHKVVSEESESRYNHRYAVVVQDLATQWIQSFPCKTKTSQETRRSLQKFLDPNRKPKVIYTHNSFKIWQSL